MINWLSILKFLPRNMLSQTFGRLARLHTPVFSVVLRNWFVHHYHIDLSEASRPLEQYRNVHELFVRELKPGVRPIADDEIVCPVDGCLSQCGALDDPDLGMIQAKGRGYSLKGLLRDSNLAERFRGGSFAVLYLAPFNYHRIHSPVDGTVLQALYCPGTLWPVNEQSVRKIQQLFCVNERLTTHLQCQQGGEILVVKVGATNVGRITVSYTSDLITNDRKILPRDKSCTIWRPQEEVHLDRAASLGVFEFGSTVVLVCDSEIRHRHPSLFQAWLGKNVRMGQSLK
ncbi:MAG TPA: archaetidylserine decarboxylase [Fibrobacteraceae bacterium]|nr:archaetidylserine decarboxylase [Fibrobacteraceae bacterium]